MTDAHAAVADARATTAPPAPPVVLTIAGSDSSGGAGIQADLKTFTALGVYGASAITALTAQSTTGVSAVHPVPPEFVAAQIAAVVTDLTVAAIKTGMLATAAIAEAVADSLSRLASGVPLVVDPVMIATSGAALIDADAIDIVRRTLLPRATLLTPNLPEAARLLATSPATTLAEAERQAAALVDLGCAAVLVKGGHAEGAEVVDVLAQRYHPPLQFARRRIATRNTHGTGCTLSAAIAAHLAQGLPLPQAVARSGDWLWRAIAAAADQRLGHGNGPVDHLHERRVR